MNDENVIVCHQCGMVLESADEYHPAEFCVLFDAGFDPWKFVIIMKAFDQELPERYSQED